MSTAAIISIITACASLINDLMPEIDAAVAKGEITPEQQQAIMDAVNKVRNANFSGPQWQIPARD